MYVAAALPPLGLAQRPLGRRVEQVLVGELLQKNEESSVTRECDRT